MPARCPEPMLMRTRRRGNEVAMKDVKEMIVNGRTALGIEFGSTRIKAVLTGEDNAPIAAGSHDWENRYEDGIWTYRLTDVWKGLQHSYQELAQDVERRYGVTLTNVGSIGFSAMMHGYMAFDNKGELLVPFRTWRNTTTAQAAEELTELFSFNIPQRWSIAHLRQAMRNGEAHVKDIDFLTTLAGYVHWRMTGERVLGIGDASGMFPIDSVTGDYNARMIGLFDGLTEKEHYPFKLRDILPKVLQAGEPAGVLTREGAALLDTTGNLQPGIPVCPPEGDAGTGMAATNSVKVRTGNVSAGTSVFAMIVMEKELSRVYREIDLVTTPDGSPVAMVHCNNCTSDLNAWVNLFKESMEAMGMEVDMTRLFSVLYNKALAGDADCGGLMSYCYFSGEPVTGFEEGRPLFVRDVDCTFNLANFMRTHLFTSLGALKIGLDILFKEEKVEADEIFGHGGLFKTKDVGQRILAAAMNTPVSVMETAGEGGAWGIALLASYMKNKENGETLDHYLSEKVFAGNKGQRVDPDPADVAGFDAFIDRYKAALPVEKAAVECVRS